MACCAWCAISGISVALSSGIGMDSSPGSCSTSWRHWRRGLAWPSNSSSRQRMWSLIWAKLRYYNVTWSGTIEPTQPPLAVAAVGRVILVLEVLQECYGRFGVEVAFG